MKLAFVLYPDMTALDLVGPYDVLSNWPGSEAAFVASVPGPITADSARPDTISYMAKQKFRIRGAKKGKGSVEDGVEFIKSFNEIIIHPRCQHTIDEFKFYSYKLDRHTEEPTTELSDKDNHCIDSIRYALEKLMKYKSRGKPMMASVGGI